MADSVCIVEQLGSRAVVLGAGFLPDLIDDGGILRGGGSIGRAGLCLSRAGQQCQSEQDECFNGESAEGAFH
jgi:hypothetical protein